MDFLQEWRTDLGGSPTFFGVLSHEDNRDYFHKRWNPETRKRYVAEYEEFILPHLDGIALEDCTRMDFDQIIDSFINAKPSCSESTVRHMRFLLKIVIKVAAKAGVCEDFLWGSIYSLPDDSDEVLDEYEFVRLRKSFTIPEELSLADFLLQDSGQSGDDMGLTLMFSLGLRNAEACGLNFGDIRPMNDHPQCFCAWIYKSTRRGSNELKTGGKTKNMDRVIPVPSVLLSLINLRRNYIKDILQKNRKSYGLTGMSNQQVDAYIDTLPIACEGHDFITRCSTSSLTKAAKKLFSKINLPENELGLIELNILNTSRSQDGVQDKDPTAYLFRRNLATHLYLLGLDRGEIQYIMGHDIDDPSELRSFYRNEDKLYQIWEKMALRPILNELATTISSSNDKILSSLSASSSSSVSLAISHKKQFQIKFQDQGYSNGTHITIDCADTNVTGTITRQIIFDNVQDPVDFYDCYTQSYAAAIANRKKRK